MSSLTTRQLFHITSSNSQVQVCPFRSIPVFLTNKTNNSNRFFNISEFSGCRNLTVLVKAAAKDGSIAPKNEDDEDGVSLGTMKLPLDIDLARFETLLFQWANSLCQGAMLPLPVPLKVDKIPGGARLGFITVEDAETEVVVYIDCLVFPATNNSPPIFRAIRNGAARDKAPPGEPRIMRSLLGALQKSLEIARV